MTRRPLLLATAIVVGATIGVAIAIVAGKRSAAPPPPAAADRPWTVLARAAPDFRLRDQDGQAVSARALRGRPAVITFLDPVCRNLCPIEARVLASVGRRLGARAPRFVAVSVNPAADTPANFRADAREWHLPATWRWATGSRAELAPVWRDYEVAVQAQTRRVAGTTVHEVAHTEEAYLVDAHGIERALFVFPFRAADVERALAELGR
ncbi:MAG TPA: SCO family protein [Gaiellaceae bacterium]|nr:SCO family protein [Gaiellaceae bacterium]